MTAPALPRRPRVVVAMVGLWVCWGSSFPAIRVMVTTLPPLLASGAVFTLAGIGLAAARPAALRGLGRRELGTAGGVGVCLLGAQGVVAVAEQRVFASTAALLVAAIPLWVVVLRALVGDRPSPTGVLRVLLGFAGVATVLVAGAEDVGGWTGWGLLVIVAAVVWAAGTVWSSRAASLPGPRATTVVGLLAGGAVLLAVGAAGGELVEVDVAGVGMASWAAVGYLVLVDSAVGFGLYHWLLRSAPVSLVSTYAYAVPVVAYVVGVVVLAEPFRPVVLIGAALIVVSVAAEVRSR